MQWSKASQFKAVKTLERRHPYSWDMTQERHRIGYPRWCKLRSVERQGDALAKRKPEEGLSLSGQMDVQEYEWKRQSGQTLPIHPSPTSALGSLPSVALSSGPERRTLPQNDETVEMINITGHIIQTSNVSPSTTLLITYKLCHSIIIIYRKLITFQEARSTTQETARVRGSIRAERFLVHSMEIG